MNIILRAGLAVMTVIFVTGCALDEDPVPSEEPMMEAAPVAPCENGDEDGIGGTGCEPLE